MDANRQDFDRFASIRAIRGPQYNDFLDENCEAAIDVLLELCGWFFFLIWLLGIGLVVADLSVRRLKRTHDRPIVRVTVIVPARDEGPKILECLRSLLDSACEGLRVIAINDRSQDDTGEVMDSIAETDSRLQVIHVTELPDGWLGKNHAMSVASELADGDFLLFTDGDVMFDPHAISMAVAHAERSMRDHLCLFPCMVAGTYAEAALVSFFGLIFGAGTQTWLVRSPLRRAYVGVGAFNLVRRSVYEKIGGHEPIRMDVLDDVKLGKLIKDNGFRSDVLHSGGLLKIRWQSSAWGVIRGLEKNAFASLNYSTTKLIIATLVFLVLFFAPYAGAIFLDGRLGYGYLATVVLAHVLFGAIGGLFGCGWRILPALPFAAIGMLFAFWRSAVKTLSRGGVCWRDTFYPLETLRCELYR